MPCGCDQACNCYVTSTVTLSITGTGTNASPYQGTVVVSPTGGLRLAGNGVAIKIDPASPAPITTSAAGLSVACCPPCANDSNSINFFTTGNCITAGIKIDPTSPAPISVSAAGIAVACCGAAAVTVADTDSVNLTLAFGQISADIINDPNGCLDTNANGEEIRMPHWRAHRSTAQVVASTGTEITWNVVEQDQGFGVPASVKWVPVPSSGIYLIVAQIHVDFQDPANDNQRVSILLTGGTFEIAQVRVKAPENGDPRLQCSVVRHIAAGTTVSVETSLTTATDTVAGISNWLSITKLSNG